ncbi:glycosyltransferase [uncultured Algibacter sp.]|uniref:glycosyltransferase n=1 Tax=uncultured Algibacter sp. TaxID=298659 RepID=UPI0032173857
MAKVHFIWWGPCPATDDIASLSRCIGMPIEVANACRDHEIIFWCKPTAQFAFNEAIGDNLKGGMITIKGIHSIPLLAGEDLYTGDEKAWYDDAQENLQTLDALRAYSAIKDLLSLIILYKEGGFYMDTTMMIKNATALNKVLSETITVPKVVQIDGGVSHQVGLQTGISIASGTDGRVDYMPTVPLIDVWTISSPIKNKSLELMFKSYVSRCNRMGLFPGGTTGNFYKIIGRDEMTGNYRNDLIGNLIIRSVYDGLIGVACDGDETRITNFTRRATKIPQDQQNNGQYALADLGVNKFHAGTWRHVINN